MERQKEKPKEAVKEVKETDAKPEVASEVTSIAVGSKELILNDDQYDYEKERRLARLDKFASAALIGIMCSVKPLQTAPEQDQAAARAFSFAEAMLKEAEKREMDKDEEDKA